MNNIRLGVPEMKDFWDTLCKKVESGKASKEEKRLHKKVGKPQDFITI